MPLDRSRTLVLVLTWLALGCASVAPEAVVPEARLPARFDDGAEGEEESIARLPWREFFADERLIALVGEALENNPDRLAALQRVEQARAGVLRATGALRPKLEAVVGAGAEKFGRYTSDGAGNLDTEISPGRLVPVHLPDLSAGFQASWEIDLWGRLRSERGAALAQVLATGESAHLVTSALVAEVAGAWFGLQAVDRIFEIVAGAVDRQQQVLEVVRLQKEAGRTSDLAVRQFEAQMSSTRALLAEISQQRVELENGLNLLLGRFPQPVERAGALVYEPVGRLASGLPSALLRQRPDVREAEFLVQASAFQVRAARAAFFPSVELGAAVGLQAFHPAYLLRLPESLAYSVVGGLVAPLVNRKAIEADFRGASSAQLEALYGYQKAVLNAYVEAANAIAHLRHVEAVAEERQKQREALERSVQTATLLFQAGKASWLEVLLAQASVLESELEWVDAWRRHRVAQVALYRALGGGWQ